MPRLPTATYRLQLHAGFTFADAEALVPYLHALGISDVYASPFLKANPGSTHGYDICDHDQLNPEIGDEASFRAWTDALARHGMGLIVDVVPNHMGLNPQTNRWWRDVLTHGQSSPYACYFDIDWDPLTPELKGRVLLPILQAPYGVVLERGDITIAREAGEFVARVGGQALPINPATIAPIVQDVPVPLVATAPTPPALTAALDALNGTAGNAASFDRLHALLDAQAYRLAFWRTAADEINYRRFFDVNDLGGLCVERPGVFAESHRLILRFIAEGRVTGVRVDHPDGLYDPAEYFARLQAAASLSGLPDAHRVKFGNASEGLYVVAEKILTDDETIPADWQVAGTTGYGFLNVVNGVFVDQRSELRLRRLWMRISRHGRDFSEEAYHARRLIMASSMASELNVLAEALRRIAAADRVTRDFTLNALRRTLLETAACFPVYRTYINERGFSAFDRDVIDGATDRARRRNPAMASSLFLFLRGVLLASPEQAPEGAERDGWLASRRRFAMKFQQFTAPVRAKGIEDTAFYRAPLLLSLNEVGGEPTRFGLAPEVFHAGNRVRLERWPLEMIGTSTHDTKRGEDARARINVLSTLPELWQRQLSAWMRTNGRCKTRVEGEAAPDRIDEFLYHQLLLGAFPAEEAFSAERSPADLPPEFVARMGQFMHKAIKEAKRHTSWVSANAAYEDAVAKFVACTLEGRSGKAFLEQFLPFAATVARLGVVNALAQLTLKIASPGVADFYQGSELWHTALADPDNRAPVDFARRRVTLEELEPYLEAAVPNGNGGPSAAAADGTLEPCVRQWLQQWTDGRLKQFITACGLRLRRCAPDLFIHGSYDALAASGTHADNLIAFSRQRGEQMLIAVVPRLMTREAGTGFPLGPDVWEDTTLRLPAAANGRRFRNLFTGATMTPSTEATLPASDLFRSCPVALLWSIQSIQPADRSLLPASYPDPDAPNPPAG